jgi:hypothetical protein
MDVGTSPPVAAPGSPRPSKDAASRVPASPDRAAAQRTPRAVLEAKRAKTVRKPPGLGLAKTKLWGSGSSQPKPLLPVTARPSHEDTPANRRRNKGSLDDDKWDITPDGGSAGREGRQFAVANVGNNGRIYLR